LVGAVDAEEDEDGADSDEESEAVTASVELVDVGVDRGK